MWVIVLDGTFHKTHDIGLFGNILQNVQPELTSDNMRYQMLVKSLDGTYLKYWEKTLDNAPIKKKKYKITQLSWF